MEKAMSDKSSYIEAVKTFNTLPKKLKCLNISKITIKKTLRNV